MLWLDEKSVLAATPGAGAVKFTACTGGCANKADGGCAFD